MAPKNILLIDDNSDMIALGRQIFNGDHYNLLSARSGAAGLEALIEHNPDVVIFEYMFPDMTGSEFLTFVATEGRYAHVRKNPFILLTAWDEQAETLTQLYASGLCAYLRKPFGHRELRCVIDSLLNSRKNGIASNSIPASSAKIGQAQDEEVRDLACSISGISRTLLRDLEDEISEQNRADMNAIFHCGKKLIKLLDSD